MPPAEIKGFIETSFVDWPGRMASVIFLGGCNYRCPYCHNHPLVTSQAGLSSWPLEKVLIKLEALRGWVDGVCVSGGEPTLNPGLTELLRVLKEYKWPVKLDTNGSRPEVLEALIGEKLLSAVSLDVKAPLEQIPYRRNAGPGADPQMVAESLGLLKASGLQVEVRTTVHPRLLKLEEVVRLAAQVRSVMGPAFPIKLQSCRVESTLDPSLFDAAPLTPAELEEWRSRIA